MRVQVLLPVTILVSVGLLAFMALRQHEQEREDKRNRFQEIKLRVSHDVLQDYQGERTNVQAEVDKVLEERKVLDEQVKKLTTRLERLKGRVDECQGEKQRSDSEHDASNTQLENLRAENEKKASVWKGEVERLKQKLVSESPVCAFLKGSSPLASKLCGKEEKKGEEKKEEPKKEEEKKEKAPKEEKKEEAPKEEKKEEAPKKEEEKKEEAPKKEEEKKEEAPEKKEEAPKR